MSQGPQSLSPPFSSWVGGAPRQPCRLQGKISEALKTVTHLNVNCFHLGTSEPGIMFPAHPCHSGHNDGGRRRAPTPSGGPGAFPRQPAALCWPSWGKQEGTARSREGVVTSVRGVKSHRWMDTSPTHPGAGQHPGSESGDQPSPPSELWPVSPSAPPCSARWLVCPGPPCTPAAGLQLSCILLTFCDSLDESFLNNPLPQDICPGSALHLEET